jgi:C4-dicarboxylate transporter DctM subunit
MACAMFGAISGTTAATMVAIGCLIISALIDNYYEERFALGVMTTVPNLKNNQPALHNHDLLYHYSIDSFCSLEDVFLAGLVPGLTITTAMCLYCYFWQYCRVSVTAGFKAATSPPSRNS